MLKSDFNKKVMTTIVKMIDERGEEWVDFNQVVSVLSPLVPPSSAMRLAEKNRIRMGVGRAKGEVGERVKNKSVQEQVIIGQGTEIRQRLSGLIANGFLEGLKNGGQWALLRVTEKGRNFDKDILPVVPKRIIPTRVEGIPVHSYKVSLAVKIPPGIEAAGAGDTVKELNLETLRRVVEAAFPGVVDVSIIE